MTTQQNELVLNHLYLADRLARAKKRKISCVAFDELQAAAFFGLVSAAARYREECGAFEFFALPCIAGAIKDYLRELSWGSRGKTVVVMEEWQEDFAAASSSASSCMEEEFYDRITDGIGAFANRIIKLYYYKGLGMKEVAAELGLSESRVSQLLSHYRSGIRRLWKGREEELWAEVA